MMGRFSKCVVLSLTFLAITACGRAQEHHVQEHHGPGSLLARASHARLAVISGRLQLTNIRVGRRSVLASKDPDGNIQEQLIFAAKTADSAELSYGYADRRQQLTVNVHSRVDFTIEQKPCGESDRPTVRVRQPHLGDFMLCVEDGDLAREVTAESFWHLMLAEPELCGDYLVPILRSLRSDWLLDAQAQRIETSLLANASRGRLPKTAKMEQLVRQLKHAEFSRRQAADRELRQMGQAAVAFLARLDERTLDVEQRTRIRQIRSALELHTDDTPARVAAWLADDRAVWVAMLEREDIATRQLAAEHLGAILGRRLAFSPEADVAQRRGQLHRLRGELGLDRPVLADNRGETLDR